MTQRADSGRVAPETPKPIQFFFVVSRNESDPNVNEFSLQGLADLFRGTEGSISGEYAIFTDRTSADGFARRQKLIAEGIRYLRSLDLAQLEEHVAITRMVAQRPVGQSAPVTRAAYVEPLIVKGYNDGR